MGVNKAIFKKENQLLGSGLGSGTPPTFWKQVIRKGVSDLFLTTSPDEVKFWKHTVRIRFLLHWYGRDWYPLALQFPPCTGHCGGCSMTIMMISKWIMQVFQKFPLCMFLKYRAPREPPWPVLYSHHSFSPRQVWTMQPGSQHHPEIDYKISSALASFTLRLAYIHFPSRKWFLLP